MTYVAENADQVLSGNFASYTLRTKSLIMGCATKE